MRCKPGDLAIIVKGANCGCPVRVVSLLDVEKEDWIIELGAPAKLFKRTGGYSKDAITGDKTCCYDKDMFPIRDNPGEDETLSWKPVPVENVMEMIKNV